MDRQPCAHSTWEQPRSLMGFLHLSQGIGRIGRIGRMKKAHRESSLVMAVEYFQRLIVGRG
jgi:hypothetical protein